MEDENFRKVFVGGLHHATTDESLKKFYEQWGEVVDCVVMRDHTTKRSRGFGFVTYAESHMIDECLRARPHKIDGKDVECKRAMPREGMTQNLAELHVTSNKLFVGSIKDEMQEEHLREYFSQFGAIASIDIVTDRATGKRRGFAFVTFEDYDPVDKVILTGEHEICGSKIGVKKALEREQKEIIAAGGSVRGRGRGGRGAPGAPIRGGRGVGGRGGARGGAVGAPGGYYNGSGDYGAPPAGGYGGYGADGYGGYSDWNQPNAAAAGGYGGWQQGGAGGGAGGWNQGYGDSGYGQGMGAPGGAMSAGNFGAGYGGGYGGGAIKGPGYTQRASGPYGGFGRGGGAAAVPGYGGAAPYGAGYSGAR